MDAPPVTSLTLVGQSASRAREVAVQLHVPLAVPQSGLEDSVVRVPEVTRVLGRDTV